MADEELVRFGRRLAQIDATCETVEVEIAESLEERGVIDDSSLDRLAAFLAEKEEHVDRGVEWLNDINHRLDGLKRNEAWFKGLRERAEFALAEVKAFLNERLAPDEEGGVPRKLEGKFHKIWAQNNPNPSVIIEREELIPIDYYERHGSFVVKADDEMALEALKAAAAELDIDIKVEDPDKMKISVSRLSEDLKAGKKIAGVKMHRNTHVRFTKIKALASPNKGKARSLKGKAKK